MSLGMDRMLMETSLRERLQTILTEFGEDEGWAMIERAVVAVRDTYVVNSRGMQQARILALRGLAEHDI